MTDAPVEAEVVDDFDDEPTDSPNAGAQDDSQGNGPDLGDAGKRAIDRMKQERDEATKQRKAAERELARLRQASLSESEKAIQDARDAGRKDTLTEVGPRLARAAFDALAARRNPDVDTDPIVEYVDMGKFLDQDGEVDRRALQAAVNRLVPDKPSGPPSQDGGPRTTARTLSMNDIIRGQAGSGRTA